MAGIKFSFSLRGLAPGATEAELADFFTAGLSASVVSIRMVRRSCAGSWVEHMETKKQTARACRDSRFAPDMQAAIDQVPGNGGPGGAYVNLSAGDPAKVLILKALALEIRHSAWLCSP